MWTDCTGSGVIKTVPLKRAVQPVQVFVWGETHQAGLRQTQRDFVRLDVWLKRAVQWDLRPARRGCTLTPMARTVCVYIRIDYQCKTTPDFRCVSSWRTGRTGVPDRAAGVCDGSAVSGRRGGLNAPADSADDDVKLQQSGGQIMWMSFEVTIRSLKCAVCIIESQQGNAVWGLLETKCCTKRAHVEDPHLICVTQTVEASFCLQMNCRSRFYISGLWSLCRLHRNGFRNRSQRPITFNVRVSVVWRLTWKNLSFKLSTQIWLHRHTLSKLCSIHKTLFEIVVKIPKKIPNLSGWIWWEVSKKIQQTCGIFWWRCAAIKICDWIIHTVSLSLHLKNHMKTFKGQMTV